MRSPRVARCRFGVCRDAGPVVGSVFSVIVESPSSVRGRSEGEAGVVVYAGESRGAGAASYAVAGGAGVVGEWDVEAVADW